MQSVAHLIAKHLGSDILQHKSIVIELHSAKTREPETKAVTKQFSFSYRPNKRICGCLWAIVRSFKVASRGWRLLFPAFYRIRAYIDDPSEDRLAHLNAPFLPCS
jgi:hypothetical protein